MYKVLSAFSKSQKSFYFQVNPLNFAFSTPWEQRHTRVRYWSALFRNGRSLRVIIDISMHNSSVMARPKERNERNSSKNAAAMVKCSALMTSHVSFQSRFPSYIYGSTDYGGSACVSSASSSSLATMDGFVPRLELVTARSKVQLLAVCLKRHVGKHHGPCLCLTAGAKFVKSLATSLEWTQLQYRRSCVDL